MERWEVEAAAELWRQLHPERVCDFCSTPEPVWVYPCDEFIIEEELPDGTRFPAGFRGAFAACDECHRLIELGPSKGAGYLLARSVKLERKYTTMLTQSELKEFGRFAKRHIRKVHEGFWKHRKTGKGYKFG